MMSCVTVVLTSLCAVSAIAAALSCVFSIRANKHLEEFEEASRYSPRRNDLTYPPDNKKNQSQGEGDLS